MRQLSTHWKRLYTIAWAVWLLDFATKSWALNALDSRNPVKLLGDFLQLTLLKNSGAAFSLAQGATIVFTFPQRRLARDVVADPAVVALPARGRVQVEDDVDPGRAAPRDNVV